MKVKTLKITGFALAILSAGFIQGSEAEDGNIEREKLECYKSGISVLNLINALHLTKEQMEKLLEINREFDRARAEFKQKPEAAALRQDAEKELGRLYEYLLSHPEEENKAIQESAAGANEKLKEYFDKNGRETAPYTDSLLQKAEDILTEEQIEVINNFKPCIIPPANLRDPIRAGQASASSAPEKALDRLRKIKDAKVLDKFVGEVADRYVRVTNERIYKMTPEEEAKKKTEIVQTLKKASALNDTDFELKKDEIALILTPEDKIKQLREEMKKRNPHTTPFTKFRENNVKRFLLNPEVVIPILEKRLSSNMAGGLK